MENQTNGKTNQTNVTPSDGEGRTGGTAENYLYDLKELKKTTVPKADYEKLQQENDQLREAVRNGVFAEPEDEEQTIVPKTDAEISEMIHDLYGDPDKQISNLEYITKVLELRQARIDRGEIDPFIPISSQYAPTQYDVETASNVAKVYQECVDYAKGDNQIFTAELMRRTKDIRVIR